MFLRQSTSQVVRFGPCLDITDGVTEETALTLAQADMRLSKDGGAFAQKSAAGSATHDSDGWYSTTLSTTDTDTVGELILNVHQPANMLPVWVRWYVVEEAVYDNLYAAAAVGPLPADSDGTVLVEAGGDGDHLTAINLPNQAMDITGDITGNLSGSVGSVTGAVGSVTGAVGSVTGAVGSVAGNVDGSTASVTGAVGSVTGAVGSVTAEVTADMTKISGSATAADNLEASALGVVPGACEGVPTTTVVQTNLAESTDDHYIGRIIVFTSGNAAGEASDITDYTGATGTVTITAVTTAPAATDTFVIV